MCTNLDSICVLDDVQKASTIGAEMKLHQQTVDEGDSPFSQQLLLETELTPATDTHNSLTLSYEQRHEINLMYHQLRDHGEQLRLTGWSPWLVDGEYCETSGAALHCENCDDVTAEEDENCSGSGSSSGRSSRSSCSGSSVCGTRFKHRRRTERWNQEFDEEVRELQGFIDRSYYPTKVYRVK